MTEQTKGTANRGTAAFLHVTARRRPQDVRLSRVPQLNLNFGGILMENKATPLDVKAQLR